MRELSGPFRGSLAVDSGVLTKSQLRGPGFRRLFPDIYLPRDVAPTLAVRSRGAHLLVAGRGALAGYSAAELLGARIAPRDADAEVVVPGGDFRECRGLRVHREHLADDEVETVAGLVVTSAIRTVPRRAVAQPGSAGRRTDGSAGGVGHGDPVPGIAGAARAAAT